MENQKKKILIATAFPTHGAGSGALVTTQAKSYVEDGHEVSIITANNRTDFDKLPGVNYHIVPFTAETENPEKIDGQVPFNYLMFTTHTESTENFWNVSLEDLEIYNDAFKKVLKDEIKSFHPDVIHAQHNWLLSSIATEMDKPVVTTIHGTDLMGYKKAKSKLEEVKKQIADMKESSVTEVAPSEFRKIEEIYARCANTKEIRREIKHLWQSKQLHVPKATMMQLMNIYDEKKKYEFYISEAEKSAKNSEKIIVISEAQKEDFAELFPYATDKVVLLENGYDPKTFYVDKHVKKDEVFDKLTSHKAPNTNIDRNYDALILFVGKFADFKGIDSLLNAAKQYETQLQEEGKNALTIIVGSGALEDKLKAQAEQLQLQNTHFVGRKQHDVICQLQNLADVSVIPSRDEPFGLVVIEGTACGHPVIGSNSGGIPGILNTSKQPLPNKDIIQTPLGILIKPLPKRPETLDDAQKDQLDVFTTEYVMANEEKQEEVLQHASETLGLQPKELEIYLEEYAKSTKALSQSVMQIVRGEMTFDNEKIADYTRENYSQEIIRNKLLDIFDEAEQLHNSRQYKE